MVIGLLERTIFVIAFILGVQLPGFIQQYSQRLAGHLTEAKQQLSQFQSLADLHFNGQLTELINRYINNPDPAISDTGEIINNLVLRVTSLENQLNALQQPDYLAKLVGFYQHIDMAIAQATIAQYQLNVPLTLEALSTGGVFALLLLTSMFLLVLSVKLGWKQLRQANNSHTASDTKTN